MNNTFRLFLISILLLSMLSCVQDSVSPILVETEPSFAVQIDSRPNNSNTNDKMLREKYVGTGFFVTSKGLVATCYHNIKDTEEITIYHQKEEYEAKIYAVDKVFDLAILAPINFPPEKAIRLQWLHKEELRLGMDILVVGNPYGLGLSYGKGIIGAINRDVRGTNGKIIRNLIQIDAAINPGFSGGLLLNTDKKVAGVISGNIHFDGSTGIGFAIPSYLADDRIKELVQYNKIRPVWIGIDFNPVLINDIKNHKYGLEINKIHKNSPAEKSNIQKNDILLAIDGISMTNSKALFNATNYYLVSQKIQCKLFRNGKILFETLTLSEKPVDPTHENE